MENRNGSIVVKSEAFIDIGAFFNITFKALYIDALAKKDCCCIR
jgi:hypothetical protein